MKIVLTERAIHEFNALNSLTRSKDEKAIELLTTQTSQFKIAAKPYAIRAEP